MYRNAPTPFAAICIGIWFVDVEAISRAMANFWADSDSIKADSNDMPSGEDQCTALFPT